MLTAYEDVHRHEDMASALTLQDEIVEPARKCGDKEDEETSSERNGGPPVGEHTVKDQVRKTDEDTREDPIVSMGNALMLQSQAADAGEYPWDAPRVILQWIKSVWDRQDAEWKQWSIDNYDGMETYEEWNQLWSSCGAVGRLRQS